jgi:hypothetical protein
MPLFDLCDDVQGPKVAFSDNKTVLRKGMFFSRGDIKTIFIATTVLISMAPEDRCSGGEAVSQFGASCLFCKRGRW